MVDSAKMCIIRKRYRWSLRGLEQLQMHTTAARGTYSRPLTSKKKLDFFLFKRHTVDTDKTYNEKLSGRSPNIRNAVISGNIKNVLSLF